MYDFISICSDTLHSKYIRSVVLEEYLLSDLKFNKESNLSFFKFIAGEKIRINGIPANSQGNYAYDSLEGVEEINLIEIAVPWKITGDSEKEVIDIANDIAKQFSWMINES
ncbi:hypothetical protein [Paenibacillus sp. NPDC058071]|uniref:hypothetical protein n=1 Tax=Paenibacillus sp. NPDC058071 TaxID=3346326 RepID=UPI0036D96A2E